jgi:hypothetical protein
MWGCLESIRVPFWHRLRPSWSRTFDGTFNNSGKGTVKGAVEVSGPEAIWGRASGPEAIWERSWVHLGAISESS